MSATVATGNPAPPQSVHSRLWILDPWRDLILFVLVPLWIVPLVWWAKSHFDFNVYGAIALALIAVGHHLPGFIRAYTDPALFRRYRVRFIVAPVFLLGVFIASSLLQLHSLGLIVVLWGAWHGAMQVNGFLRIYDAKVGATSVWTARLDRAMCLAWFGSALFHSNSRVTAILLHLYSLGVSPVDPESFALFRTVWEVSTACITLAFAFNAWREAQAGRASSPVKFLLMASSYGFFWFAMVVVQQPLMGLVLFEIFHDIQYNTLVWVFNRTRVSRHLGSGRLETFLFGPGLWRIALYTVLVIAYGTLGAVTGYSSTLVPESIKPALENTSFWTGLFTVSVFLHFYFDGFIWQVREQEIRQGLGIDGKRASKGKPESDKPGVSPRRPFRMPVGWKWAFFVIPVTLLGALELQGHSIPPTERYRNISRILPECGPLHYLLANMEKSGSDFGGAMEEYSRSIALDPAYEPAYAELADVEAFLRLDDLALSHYFRAVELDSLDFGARARLALTLLRVNRIAEALPYLLETAQRTATDTTLIYMTGAALMHENRPAEAVPYLQRTLMLDPRQPRAWSFLGVAARLGGDSVTAEECYRRALALDPKNAWKI